MSRRTLLSVRCHGHSSRTGEPCKRWATHGATVCSTHGAAAPQVKAAAERNVTDLYPNAVDALERAVNEEPGESSLRSAAVTAAKVIVEYRHGKPKERIDVAVLNLAALIRLARQETQA